MPKTVVLIGHCGMDSEHLRWTVSKAVPEALVVLADDEAELRDYLSKGVDLLLFNRQLSGGFDDRLGVDLIRRLRARHPQVKMILVSNYPESQGEAMAAGAMGGFGKRQMNSPHVVELLRAALDG